MFIFLSFLFFFFSFFFFFFFFFFNDTATTEIYTLSLHDALPILEGFSCPARPKTSVPPLARRSSRPGKRDRKSTRLNSSHVRISYAVFCLKKKKKKKNYRQLKKKTKKTKKKKKKKTKK